MRRDFTVHLYKEFLESALVTGYELTTFQHHVENAELLDRVVILRHDLDKKPLNALRMAEIEHAIGLSATYYFRIVEKSFDREVIKKIANFGHEIGYHMRICRWRPAVEIGARRRVGPRCRLG